MTQIRSGISATTKDISSAFQDTQPSPNKLIQKSYTAIAKNA